MTPLPKRRHSTRRSGKRQAAHQLHVVKLVKCSNCGQTKRPHEICPNCGFYDHRLVIPPKKEKAKR